MVVVVVVVPSLPTPKFKLNSFTGRYLLPDVLAQRVYGSVPPGGKKVKLYFILSFFFFGLSKTTSRGILFVCYQHKLKGHSLHSKYTNVIVSDRKIFSPSYPCKVKIEPCEKKPKSIKTYVLLLLLLLDI